MGGVERRKVRGVIEVLARESSRITLKVELEVEAGKSRAKESWRGEVEARISNDARTCPP